MLIWNVLKANTKGLLAEYIKPHLSIHQDVLYTTFSSAKPNMNHMIESNVKLIYLDKLTLIQCLPTKIIFHASFCLFNLILPKVYSIGLLSCLVVFLKYQNRTRWPTLEIANHIVVMAYWVITSSATSGWNEKLYGMERMFTNKSRQRGINELSWLNMLEGFWRTWSEKFPV